MKTTGPHKLNLKPVKSAASSAPSNKPKREDDHIGTFDDLMDLDPANVKRISVEKPRPRVSGILGKTSQVQ